MSLRIRLFGVPSIECDGAIVSVAVRRHCVVLLAIIVLGDPDRRRSRRAVAAELWPDDDESTAVANLRRHLSFLSAAIPALDACIGRDRDALWCIASQVPWCDVVAFERGELDLYRGDFMEGFEHEWVVTQRERLREMAITGFVARAETLREDGDEVAAIACARRAVEIDPLNESIAQFEIELHGERGDLASVDAAFAALERRLREIDAEPSAESAALVENFRRLAREAAARIPRPLTSFVETAALAEVMQLVRTHRLVTIVGPGGVGKTRLALESAHRLASTFADGAYFVDLSAVLDGDTLPDVLTRELGLPMGLPTKGFAGVNTFLRNRRALLLLDNCEQIAAACARFLTEALVAAPHLHVLATSREPLGLGAEHHYRLRPLALADATQLLMHRAYAVGWDGDGVPNAPKRFQTICTRLDGLPLAIELAASVLGTLSLGDLERHLSADVAQLRSRDVTAPPRHRSLGDVIAWSVNLLTPGEREIFVRLAVFAGSFSAEAARAICKTDIATLAELVAKSVLVREDAADGRFIFLNSISEYARHLLDADPSASAVREAHAAFYADLAMQSEEPTFWSSQRTWLQEIDRDYHNVSQALRWSLVEKRAVQSGLRLAIGLGFYYARRGMIADGATWTDIALERSAPASREFGLLSYNAARFAHLSRRFEGTIEHAQNAQRVFSNPEYDRYLSRALVMEAAGLFWIGRAVEADAVATRALPLAVRSGDRRSEAFILAQFAALRISDPSAAREQYVLALRLFEEIGDALMVGKTLADISETDCRVGRYEAAAEYLERALTIARDAGEPFQLVVVLGHLGDIAVLRGDLSRARDCFEETLTLCETYELEFFHDGILSSCAALAAERRNYALGARLLGASLRDEKGPMGAAHQRVQERARITTESALDVDELALEMRFGRELARGDALKLARSVFALPARGVTKPTIISPRTVQPKVAARVRAPSRRGISER